MSENEFRKGVPVLKPGECIIIKKEEGDLVSICNEYGDIKVKKVEER